MRRFAVLLAALVLSTAGLVFGQDGAWYEEKPIASVEFQGLNRIKVRELEPIVRPFFSKPLTSFILEDIKRRLFDTDFFEGLDVEAKQGPDGEASVILVFVVEERPVINRILVEGSQAVRVADLLEVVKVKAGDFVSRPKAAAGVQEILKLYIARGFSQAKVDFRIESPAAETGLQDLVYTISEGKRTVVQALRFSGNAFVAEGTLKGQLKSSEMGLFNQGLFQEANLEIDREKLLTWYRDNGYLDVRITDILRTEEQDAAEQQTRLTITYVIDEGQQYTFNGFTLEGNEIFTTAHLLGLTRSKVGEVLNFTRLQADLRAVTEAYFDQGYALNDWDFREERDAEKKTIGYLMRVIEKGVVYIGEINIRGNVKTKQSIIERELPFKTGDVFSRKKLIDGLASLMNTRYFKNVIPEPMIVGNLMQINITVEEQNTTDVRFGASVSGDESLPISLMGKYSDINFLGNGSNFGIDLTVSPTNQSLAFNFYDGWLLGDDLGGGTNLTISRQEQVATDLHDNSSAPGSPDSGFGASVVDYINWNIPLNLSLSKVWRTPIGRVGISPSIGTQLTNIWYDVKQGVPQDNTIANNLDKFVLTNNLSLTAYLDGRDLFFDPSNGYYLYQNVKFFGGFLFGARDYISTETTVQGWLTLWDVPLFEGFNWKTVLGANSSLSVLWPQFWTASGSLMNLGENRLRINPMMVARGWSNWSTALELPNGGDALWNNWVELRTPIVKGVLSLDGFFDAVRLTSDREQIFAPGGDGWLFGFGAGLRLTMQNLPLRLYLGKRFSVDDNGQVQWQRGTVGPSSPTSDDGLDLILSISLM